MHSTRMGTRIRSKAGVLLAGGVVLLAAVGCHSKTAATPANFVVALNAYFMEHPECLFPQAPRFPYEATDPAEMKPMDALVKEQMLTTEVEPSIHVSRYTPTDAGARAAPRFCYGHRMIASIDSFTPPAQADGFMETQVTYRYTMDEVPVWAESDGMRAAFPAMAVATSGAGMGKVTLASSMAGWTVPD
ncbi:MAG: hypothetical protein ABR910_15465 [Acidobacteriaceae bacterium]